MNLVLRELATGSRRTSNFAGNPTELPKESCYASSNPQTELNTRQPSIPPRVHPLHKEDRSCRSDHALQYCKYPAVHGHSVGRRFTHYGGIKLEIICELPTQNTQF